MALVFYSIVDKQCSDEFCAILDAEAYILTTGAIQLPVFSNAGPWLRPITTLMTDYAFGTNIITMVTCRLRQPI